MQLLISLCAKTSLAKTECQETLKELSGERGLSVRLMALPDLSDEGCMIQDLLSDHHLSGSARVMLAPT